MMSVLFWPLFLLFVALGFVILELMLPSGGALSFLAAVSAIASVVVAFMNGGLTVGSVWMTSTCLLFPMVIWLAFRVWPYTPFGRQLFNIPETGTNDSHDRRQALLGRYGIAVSVMIPAGRSEIDGDTWDAVTEGMSVEKGQPVEVTEVAGNRIVVRPSSHSVDVPMKSAEDLLSRPLDSFDLEGLDEPLS